MQQLNFYVGSRSRQQQQECGNTSRGSAAAPPPSLIPDLFGRLSGRWLTTLFNAQGVSQLAVFGKQWLTQDENITTALQVLRAQKHLEKLLAKP